MGSRPARYRYCRCGTRLAAERTDRFRQAFDAQHIGWLARAYRTHPHHCAVYGPSGISQTVLGQWLGLSQAQLSRIETGAPIRHLDALVHWVRVLRIPPELLWFRLPPEEPPEEQESPPATHPREEPADPVLAAPWNHRGTVEAVVALSCGDGRVVVMLG